MKCSAFTAEKAFLAKSMRCEVGLSRTTRYARPHHGAMACGPVDAGSCFCEARAMPGGCFAVFRELRNSCKGRASRTPWHFVPRDAAFAPLQGLTPPHGCGPATTPRKRRALYPNCLEKGLLKKRGATAHKPCKGGQITAGGERSVTPGNSGTR